MATNTTQRGNLVWVDLEMTGLGERHVILEIATIITDKHLNVIAEGPEIAVHRAHQDIRDMEVWSERQHRKSGLIDRVMASDIDIWEAERLTLDFVRQHVEEGQAPLCGNSVWVDRLFLRREMPKFEQYLHHRVVDVSTIKELVARWYPESEGAPPKEQEHLALADIRESINELRWYRDNCFHDPEQSRNMQG